MAGIGHRGFMGRNKGCGDSDGQAFITAAGITDPTQQAAICQLVKDLKGVGSTTNNTNAWARLVAAYPFPNTDFDSCKVNLVSPLNYTLILNNITPTFSSLGVQASGSGTSVFIAPVSAVNIGVATDGMSIGASVRDIVTPDSILVGGQSYSTQGQAQILYRANATQIDIRMGRALIFNHGGANGIWHNNLTIVGGGADDTIDAYKNGAFIATRSNDLKVWYNNSVLTNHQLINNLFNNGYLNFYYIGKSMTPNEIQDVKDSIATFNTSLSR